MKLQIYSPTDHNSDYKIVEEWQGAEEKNVFNVAGHCSGLNNGS